MLNINTKQSSTPRELKSSSPPSSPSKKQAGRSLTSRPKVSNNSGTLEVSTKKGNIPADMGQSKVLIGMSPSMPHGTGEQLELIVKLVTDELKPENVGAFPGEDLEIHNYCIKSDIPLAEYKQKEEETKLFYQSWLSVNTNALANIPKDRLHKPSSIEGDALNNYVLVKYVIEQVYAKGNAKFKDAMYKRVHLKDGINADVERYLDAHYAKAKDAKQFSAIDPEIYRSENAYAHAKAYKFKETAYFAILALRHGYNYFCYKHQQAPAVAGLCQDILWHGLELPITIRVDEKDQYKLDHSVHAPHDNASLVLELEIKPIVLQELYKNGETLADIINKTRQSHANVGSFIIHTTIQVQPDKKLFRWLDIRISDKIDDKAEGLSLSSSSDSSEDSDSERYSRKIRDVVCELVEEKTKNAINNFIILCERMDTSHYVLLKQIEKSLDVVNNTIEYAGPDLSAKIISTVPYLIFTLHHNLNKKLLCNDTTETICSDEIIAGLKKNISMGLKHWLAQFIGYYQLNSEILNEVDEVLRSGSYKVVSKNLESIQDAIPNYNKVLNFEVLDSGKVSPSQSKRLSTEQVISEPNIVREPTPPTLNNRYGFTQPKPKQPTYTKRISPSVTIAFTFLGFYSVLIFTIFGIQKMFSTNGKNDFIDTTLVNLFIFLAGKTTATPSLASLKQLFIDPLSPTQIETTDTANIFDRTP
jgi:hypothetical protein